MRDYLTRVHPFAGKRRIGHAPLFPGKRTRAGKTAVSVEDFDWAKPIVVDNVYHNYFQPACKALGLGRVRFTTCGIPSRRLRCLRGTLHAGVEVVRALQFRADANHLRRLHP